MRRDAPPNSLWGSRGAQMLYGTANRRAPLFARPRFWAKQHLTRSHASFKPVAGPGRAARATPARKPAVPSPQKSLFRGPRRPGSPFRSLTPEISKLWADLGVLRESGGRRCPEGRARGETEGYNSGRLTLASLRTRVRNARGCCKGPLPGPARALKLFDRRSATREPGGGK